VHACRSTLRSLAIAAALAVAASACGKSAAPAKASIDAGGTDAEAESAAADGPADAAVAHAAPKLTLGEVKLQRLGWDERVPRPDDASLRATLDAAMTKASLLRPGAGDAIPAKVELGVGLGFEGAPGKETRVDAAVSLRLRWKEAGATRSMESRVIGQLPVDADGRKHLPERAQAAIERALADATSALALRDGIRRGDEATVIRALDHEDTDVRAEAFRAVSDRRMTAAVPRVIELLKSTNAEIRDAAIGALVELQDRRGVKPLVDMVEFKDLDMMRRIIDAVGMIGGDEARDYLEFVASGHETPVVRQLAQDALDRLTRREAEAAAAAHGKK
jgi:hypothetical protein